MERTFNLMVQRAEDGSYIGDIFEFPELRVHAMTYVELFAKAEKIIKIHLSELEDKKIFPDVLANYRLTVDV